MPVLERSEFGTLILAGLIFGRYFLLVSVYQAFKIYHHINKISMLEVGRIHLSLNQNHLYFALKPI